MLFKAAMVVIASAVGVSALGINCEGSGYCGSGWNPGANNHPLQELADIIDYGIDDNRWYGQGEHVACDQSSGVCAFVQKASGASGGTLAIVARDLANHGCTVCGSVPLDFPRTNDVNNGELTFNFVGGDDMGSCSGLC